MFRNEVSSRVIDNIFAAARCVCSKIVKLTPFTPGKIAEIDESLFRNINITKTYARVNALLSIRNFSERHEFI